MAKKESFKKKFVFGLFVTSWILVWTFGQMFITSMLSISSMQDAQVLTAKIVAFELKPFPFGSGGRSGSSYYDAVFEISQSRPATAIRDTKDSFHKSERNLVGQNYEVYFSPSSGQVRTLDGLDFDRRYVFVELVLCLGLLTFNLLWIAFRRKGKPPRSSMVKK
jgi:hypothetical protein